MQTKQNKITLHTSQHVSQERWGRRRRVNTDCWQADESITLLPVYDEVSLLVHHVRNHEHPVCLRVRELQWRLLALNVEGQDSTPQHTTQTTPPKEEASDQQKDENKISEIRNWVSKNSLIWSSCGYLGSPSSRKSCCHSTWQN
jgi:hypothetical protein